MDNAELLQSNEIIEDSGSEDQTQAFEDAISALNEEELAAINDYLNAGVAPESDWTDYWDAFAKHTWHEFGYAYSEVMGRDLSLD